MIKTFNSQVNSKSSRSSTGTILHQSSMISQLAKAGLLPLLILIPVLLFTYEVIHDPAYHLHMFQFSSRAGTTLPQTFRRNPQCNCSLFYNKPPKTASTFIQITFSRFVNEPYRFIPCGGKRALETNLYLPDCLPRADDGCNMFSAHVRLTNDITKLVHERLPTAMMLTSTRYPAHRIASFYLQINRLKMMGNGTLESGMYVEDADFENWIRKFNPWSLYNYHTGESRSGSCPLSATERIEIFDVASKYDLVIDANLVRESNAILSHYGLFTLPMPKKADKANFRGALQLNLSERSKELIRNVSCVEVELHRALHIRMASLYEKTTGEQCINHGDLNDLSSCLEKSERQALNGTWTV